MAPRLPLSLRPRDGQFPSAARPWYRGLSFGPGAELDILWYGGGHFDSLGAYFPLPPAVHSAGQGWGADAGGRSGSPGLPGSGDEASLTLLRFEWEPGPLGYMRWFLDGALVLDVPAESLGEYRKQGEGVRARLVPEEPLYLVVSVAVSRSFSGGIDESLFPTRMRLGHVRLYQRADRPQAAQCSPPDHPTADWIAQHWWANGQQAPPEVDSLLRLDRLAYGAAGALGLLALAEGRDAQTRLPLALTFGAFLTAALASAAMSRYLGLGAHAEGAAAEPASVSSSAAEAADSLATFLRLASSGRARERSVDRDADLAHERAQAAAAAAAVADHVVYLACVAEAAAVGGLLLTILGDATLALACAYSTALLALQLHASHLPALLPWLWIGTLHAAQDVTGVSGMPPAPPPLGFQPPPPADASLSLAVFPLFLAVLLASGLALLHVRDAFLAVATALAGAQLLQLAIAALILGQGDAAMQDVRHLINIYKHMYIYTYIYVYICIYIYIHIYISG